VANTKTGTTPTEVESPPKTDPVYSRDELIAAASSFGVRPEVVAGALRLAGKDAMTRAEAQVAIAKFLQRRV
jgi:hypothetical protein